ncbi:hypothetical protein HNQ07_003531 [Deinococcus metalli]|uniref:ABC transporter permease n=1 Tax=Deinococcus metalli TaxID=1141878 RepID=A0A7W8KHK3_9DEIO|nr:hypothetical protein [Deinococcus metalli]MBB5378030.1 hypothetical protein [Deinococcus metalli]GHF53882.1 hypothetical protein GCM10017781_32710 [Deinococcus metalli]
MRPTPPPSPRALVTVLGIGLLIPLIVTTLLTVFAWPAYRTAPHHLPVGLVTTATLSSRLPALLETSVPGGFSLTTYENEARARLAIKQREVYGAILLDPARPADFKVLTASAGSPAAANVISGLGTQVGTVMAAAGFSAPQVEDVVPATAQDPRQATLIGAVLPLVLSGMVTGLLISTRLHRVGARLAAVSLVGLLTGLSMGSVMQFGFHTLTGSYLLNSVVIALAVGSVAALVTGLETVLGLRGLGVAGALLLLLSNPFSALTSAPELLPGWWGPLGQLLPLGAFGRLLRSVAFFGGAGGQGAMWVLVFWLALGLVLIAAGSRHHTAREGAALTPSTAS